jgi:hypothetical protein
VPIVTIGIGLVLAVLGIGFFFGTAGEEYHFTALIPLFFGVVLLILGWLARHERFLKHAMHAAAALGLIGFAGGFVMALKGLLGSKNEVRAATIEQALLALICALFVGLCVRSFIAARRRRAQVAKG